MLIILFLVLHFNSLFVLCGRLSWLPVSFLLHVKHTLSYRVVNIAQREEQRKQPELVERKLKEEKLNGVEEK